MSFDDPPRKLVRHFHEPGDLHELTFSCFHRKQLLISDAWRSQLARSIDRAGELQRFELIAFVFMPEHVHLLVTLASEAGHRQIPLGNQTAFLA
jgi:REP-associated tyrosine transposase